MVKFLANSAEAGVTLGLGVSRGNIERLTQGKPITVDLLEMGFPEKGQVFIFFGETEAEMKEMLRPMIGPNTTLITPAEKPGETPEPAADPESVTLALDPGEVPAALISFDKKGNAILNLTGNFTLEEVVKAVAAIYHQTHPRK